MMDVLFVVPYVPNLIRVRPYNLIRSLSARGHRVTLLTVWTNEQELADLDKLRQEVYAVQALPMPVWRSMINLLPALVTGAPLQSAYSWQPQLARPYNGRSPFDLIHVEHLRGARYALQLKKQTKLPVVWDSVDCITHLFTQAAAQSKSRLGRWRSRFELGRTRRYEGWLLDQFDRVLVTSRIDRDAMQRLRPVEQQAPIDVVENGVDLHYFRPNPTITRDPATIVVSGKMSYHANVSMVLHLAHNIMPHVWAQQPQVKLQIVGKDPTPEIQALAANPQVEVTGFVHDIRPYLQQATIAVSPLTYGAGVQNKVLEAMACGTPVVTANQAIAALNIQPGRDVLVADDPRVFAHQLLALLGNPRQQRQIGQAARAYVETHHDWNAIAGKLENIYQQAIQYQRQALTSIQPMPLP